MKGFPGGPVVKTMPGVRVRSLVRELRSHVSCSAPKFKKNVKENNLQGVRRLEMSRAWGRGCFKDSDKTGDSCKDFAALNSRKLQHPPSLRKPT